jgi:hypothetical protein
LVVECLIAFALVLAEALPLLLVESVLIVTLFLRLEVFRVLSVAHVKRISRRARLQSCPTKGRSSVGRAAVSKTVGRGFESLRPCFPFKPNGLPSSGFGRRRGHLVLRLANAHGDWLILGADRRDDGTLALDGLDFGREEPRTCSTCGGVGMEMIAPLARS